MLDFFLVLLASFCAGLAAKAADSLEQKSFFSYFFAFLYGFFLFILSSFFGLATLFVSLALANFVAGKIDSKTHLFGFFVFVLGVLIFDFSIDNFWLFGLFFIAGFLDELFSNSKILFLKNRIFLPLLALAYFLFFSNPIYFFSILFFDFGYKLFIFLKPKLKL
ncbi:MAG: hypothetical protein N3D10_00665 [Candidatus Micrarchaeota archaeon]|nr:hypothetical protein [Candidatus Micrarchaeota archaeon]